VMSIVLGFNWYFSFLNYRSVSFGPCGTRSHIGSEQAGPRVAAILSVVETCRRLNIPIREYLCSILPGLANFPINRIAELTPACWPARAKLQTLSQSRPTLTVC
jgi:hypothetical protein